MRCHGVHSFQHDNNLCIFIQQKALDFFLFQIKKPCFFLFCLHIIHAVRVCTLFPLRARVCSSRWLRSSATFAFILNNFRKLIVIRWKMSSCVEMQRSLITDTNPVIVKNITAHDIHLTISDIGVGIISIGIGINIADVATVSTDPQSGGKWAAHRHRGSR